MCRTKYIGLSAGIGNESLLQRNGLVISRKVAGYHISNFFSMYCKKIRLKNLFLVNKTFFIIGYSIVNGVKVDVEKA